MKNGVAVGRRFGSIQFAKVYNILAIYNSTLHYYNLIEATEKNLRQP